MIRSKELKLLTEAIKESHHQVAPLQHPTMKQTKVKVKELQRQSEAGQIDKSGLSLDAKSDTLFINLKQVRLSLTSLRSYHVLLPTCMLIWAEASGPVAGFLFEVTRNSKRGPKCSISTGGDTI